MRPLLSVGLGRHPATPTDDHTRSRSYDTSHHTHTPPRSAPTKRSPLNPTPPTSQGTPFGRCVVDLDGEVGWVEMLGSTSLVALVGGGGDRPAFSPRKVVVYNTKTRASICEVAFKTVVLGVRLNRRRLVVILEARVHIFDMQDMSALHVVDTGHNPRGLCVLSAYEGGGGGGGSGLEGSGSGSGDHTGMCPLVAPCSSGVTRGLSTSRTNGAPHRKQPLYRRLEPSSCDLLAVGGSSSTP